MLRIEKLVACAALLLCGNAAGQSFSPRSLDYLFASTANDARAIWLNPAGLAVLPEASILAEMVVHRNANADLRVSQVSMGFNSQGLSFGYNRDRLVTDSSNHTYRLGLARALPGWSLGIAVSHHRSDRNDTGFDAGIRYRLLRSLDLGLVLRNIGQPQIRRDTLPLTGVASLGWAVLPGFLVLTGETLAENRLSGTGFDMSYRAGARMAIGMSLPIAGITAVRLDNDFNVVTWSFGVTVGGSRRGVMVAAMAPNNPGLRLETLSLTTIAVNQLAAWRH